jgi:lipopolysaccharide transport system permease protein
VAVDDVAARSEVRATNPHLRPPAGPVDLLRSLHRGRTLILQMARREILGRYRGSLFGLLWSFLNPAIMLLVYTFVFSVVFRVRWTPDATQASTPNFAVLLFVGMIVHGLFAECVNRAPTLILANANLVKRVIFPLEVLPPVAMASALFHAAVSLLVLLLAFPIGGVAFRPTILLFPLVILPLVLLALGLSWVLAAMGVFIRDIGQVTAIFTLALMFLSPVFYPASALPREYRILLVLNPLTYIIDEARNVLIWGQLLDWPAWSAYTACSLVVAWAGFWWFQRTRRAFADVL